MFFGMDVKLLVSDIKGKIINCGWSRTACWGEYYTLMPCWRKMH